MPLFNPTLSFRDPPTGPLFVVPGWYMAVFEDIIRDWPRLEKWFGFGYCPFSAGIIMDGFNTGIAA